MFKDLVCATYDTLATYDTTRDIRDFVPLVQELKDRNPTAPPPAYTKLSKAVRAGFLRGKITPGCRGKIVQAAARLGELSGL